MLRDHRNAISSVSFMLTIAGSVLGVLSIALMMVFVMDSMVTDLDESDFDASGDGVHGAEYSAKAASMVIGTLGLTITDEDDEGWAWLMITLDGQKVQRMRNVSFPFSEQYPLTGGGDIVVIVVPPSGSGIDDLDVGLSVPGPLGLVSAITGFAIAGPCCAAWLGSLAAAMMGIYIATLGKGRREGRRWS